jgi:hypothetical protein
MGWSTLATGAQNALEVRNWKVHLVASTSALVRKSSFVPKLTSTNFGRTVGYDTSVIGRTTAHDSLRRDFGLADAAPSHRDTVQGNNVSTFRVSTRPSGRSGLVTDEEIVPGWLLLRSTPHFLFAEKYGRRLTVMAASAVLLVRATLMTAADGKMYMVVAGRTVAGLGIGACVPVYISETASPSLRGRLIDILEIASHGGGILFGSVTSNGVGHSDPGLSESWIPSRRCHSATQRWRGGGLCWAPSLVGPRRAIRRRA